MLAIARNPFIALTLGAVFERLDVLCERSGRVQAEFFSLRDHNV